MKQVKIFESSEYGNLQRKVNKWICDNGVIIINTSLSAYMSSNGVYYCMSVLYEA